MRVAMVLFLFAGVLVLDARPVLKGAAKTLKIVYFSMIIPSLVLLMLYSLGIKMPAPGVVITNLLKR